MRAGKGIDVMPQVRKMKLRSNAGAEIFALMIAPRYFQVEIEEGSRHLTTFLLPSSHYHFRWAPIGLNASGDEFNYRSDLEVEGLQWILKIVDDILVYAPDMPKLFARVRVLLTCIREHGVKLSSKKMLIGDSVKLPDFWLPETE